MGRQAGLSTGDMARRVAEKEPDKLAEELKARQHELGLDNMIPNKRQDMLQQLDDIRNESNNILDQMQKAKEERLKRDAEKRKANQKTPLQKLKMIRSYEERQARGAYDERRLVYPGGGFEKYESTIRMMPFRVLLKEIDPPQSIDGIIVPESHTEKFPRYVVIACGEGCDEVEKGDVVMVQPYAGTEIASARTAYRIVTCDDIILKEE